MITTNKYLKKYLEFVFNKSIVNIKLEELNNIKHVSLEGNYNENNNYRIDLTDISLLHNIDSMSISNALLTVEDMLIICKCKIKHLFLNKCVVDNDDNFTHLNQLESLTLVNCFNDNYNFLEELSNLKKLTIINPYNQAEINIGNINDGIEEVTLQKCNLVNLSEFIKKQKIKLLNVLWSDIKEEIIPYINEIASLKEIYIDDNPKSTNIRRDILVRKDYIPNMFDNGNYTL